MAITVPIQKFFLNCLVTNHSHSPTHKGFKQTRTVDLRTVVWFKDANQSQKCPAKQIAEKHVKTQFLRVIFGIPAQIAMSTPTMVTRPNPKDIGCIPSAIRANGAAEPTAKIARTKTMRLNWRLINTPTSSQSLDAFGQPFKCQRFHGDDF